MSVTILLDYSANIFGRIVLARGERKIAVIHDILWLSFNHKEFTTDF